MIEAARIFAAVSVVLSAASALVRGTKYESLIKLVVFAALLLALISSFKNISFELPEYDEFSAVDAEIAYEESLVLNAERDLQEVLLQELEEYETDIVSLTPKVNIDGEDRIYLEQLKIYVQDTADKSAIYQMALEIVGDAVVLEVNNAG